VTTEPRVLYEDDVLVVLDKPSGLVVHRGWATDRVTVMSWVRRLFGRNVDPVHRLDRATSGVLVLCRDSALLTRVQAQFEAGTVVKNYLALTRGITPERGLIDHGLRKSKEHERRAAKTSIRRLGTWERYSLVEARPHTGRQHQIRRHLKHISHPLLGDTRYGKGEHNRRFRSEFDLMRLCLHASRLSLTHPRSGQALTFSAELPGDLRAPFARLGLDRIAADACDGETWAPGPTDLPVLCRDEDEALSGPLAENRRVD
jgi:tRNA pseudouridine65 synthase